MKAEAVSFRHAVEILRNEGTATIPGGPIKVLKSQRSRGKLPTPFNIETEDRELLKQVVEYYHQTLKQCPEGLAYLEKRGLMNSEMVSYFKLGYSNRTLGLRLPESNYKTGALIRERLHKIGIYRDSGHEHFNGSVVFPIFDEHAQVTEVYGRKIIERLREGTIYHLYLPGPHKGIFNLQAVQSSKDIILCEAIIDALTFWCAGFRNVTASYGVNGFTPDHLEAFKRYGVERVYIAYDRDVAGDKAAHKLAEELIIEGFECFRVLFPRGMDANEYALKTKPAEKALDLVFRNATWIGKGNRSQARLPVPAEEEPKAATKGKNMPGEIPGPETISQVSSRAEEPTEEPKKPEIPSQSLKEEKKIFPLAAEKTPDESPKPEPARNAPVSKTSELVTAVRDEEIIITVDDRRWRVRGLKKNMTYEQLKLNLLVSLGEKFHVDTFDMYSARFRAAFLKQASEELRIKEDILKSDLGKILLKIEELQDKQIRETLEPKEKEVVLTEAEKTEASEFLKDPNLLPRILDDFGKCGIVGEETNKLVGYLAAISRKLERPLAIIIQSSSSAGKTSLMESFLHYMPEEDKVKYSAMTGQSLFYMGETNLKNKILAIVEEKGAENASYALKLLLSEGVLTIASTGKDPHTGRLITHEYKVEGPVMLFITTTNIDISEELQNRCIMLTVDESREQTRAIHRLQREMETLEGLLALREREWIYKRHRNAQRLLKAVLVSNPYARHLTFLDDTMRTRRDHMKYLTLIRSIALLHQFQRPHKKTVVRGSAESYLEVTFDDIELANRLANEVLGRSLDELLPQSRRFLDLLFKMVKKRCAEEGIEQADLRFYRREVCNFTTWSLSQVRVHLDRLVDMEYVLIHKGCRGQSFVYELLYNGEGKDGEPFVLGLLDIAKLKEKMNSNYVPNMADFSLGVAESNEKLAGPKRPQSAPKTGGWRTPESQPSEAGDEVHQDSISKTGEKTHIGDQDKQESSYSQSGRNPIAAKKES
jgi:DNA primase